MSIGVDIVKIERIRSLLEHPGFLERFFTAREREYLKERNNSPTRVAGMFAAKEAISKVLGTGIGRLALSDMEILHNDAGEPTVSFSESARKLLESRGLVGIELSISHENEYATAVAVGGASRRRLPAGLRINPDLALSLVRRDRDGYKTQYGKVAVIGGSVGMAGSVCMAAQAALRTGAGMVYAVVPKSIADIVQIKLTEVIVRPIEDEGRGHFLAKNVQDVIKAVADCDAVAVGPGIGRTPGGPLFLREIVENTKCPLVLDADALYALAQDRDILKSCPGRAVITPHAMEMSRLTGYTTREIARDRARIASEFADKNHIMVVLKGAATVICDGPLYFLNNTGNPGMATAGSGDVLTGMMAALLGYGYRQLLAVRLAVYIHGLAGDLAKLEIGEDGMIATDLIKRIPRVLKILQELKEDESN